MARTKRHVHEPTKDLAVSEETELFPLVVLSFDGKLPGQEGYDKSKDRMTTGFYFGQSTVPSWLPQGTKLDEVTAYDFLTNPKTGLRKGFAIPPHHAQAADLTDGISSWVSFPPVHIWSEGRWLGDIIDDDRLEYDALPYQLKQDIEKAKERGEWPRPSSGKHHAHVWNIWVTSGEGSPGNNLYKLFELPKEQATRASPQHPTMWPEALKKGKWNKGGGSTLGYGGLGLSPPPAKPAQPALPAGVRVRHEDCGHWFKIDDLKGHVQVCGKGEDSDWAVMCDPACGCRNLHEAAAPKPGFPRPKPEVAVAATNGAAATEQKEEVRAGD